MQIGGGPFNFVVPDFQWSDLYDMDGKINHSTLASIVSRENFYFYGINAQILWKGGLPFKISVSRYPRIYFLWYRYKNGRISCSSLRFQAKNRILVVETPRFSAKLGVQFKLRDSRFPRGWFVGYRWKNRTIPRVWNSERQHPKIVHLKVWRSCRVGGWNPKNVLSPKGTMRSRTRIGSIWFFPFYRF